MAQDSHQSAAPPAGELSAFYCLLEFDWQGTMRLSLAFATYAHNEREAAEKAAGYQLSREAAPRRIRVFTAPPVDFEWRRVDNYLCEVGAVEQ